jgi:hypothetical protein
MVTKSQEVRRFYVQRVLVKFKILEILHRCHLVISYMNSRVTFSTRPLIVLCASYMNENYTPFFLNYFRTQLFSFI